MILRCAWSVALVGVEGRMVEVEADIGGGLPRTVLVGLPDTALYEARDRCKAAVANSGHTWPSSLLTINLSPGHAAQDRQPLRPGHRRGGARRGRASFALTGCSGRRCWGSSAWTGGSVPSAACCRPRSRPARPGFTRVVVPLRQAAEARLVDGIDVLGVASLGQLIAEMRGDPVPRGRAGRAD